MLNELNQLITARVANVDHPLVVALDGRSGTGKSTLAVDLAVRHEGQAITADDFWCGADLEELLGLTPLERAATSFDWKRLRTDVLEPLHAGRPASWQPFNWGTGSGLSDQALVCPPVPVGVIDGAYSTRPELADLIDISVLVTLDDDTRRARLVRREGETYMTQWHSLWDAAEDHYFKSVRPPDSFDLVLNRDTD